MKKQEIPIKGTEIEGWAEWLDEQPRITPISKTNFETFFRLTLINSNKEKAAQVEEEIGPKLNAERILISRFECFGYKITNIAALMTCLLIEEFSPGNMVIYANYLAYKCKKNNWDTITPDMIMRTLFPFGGFSKETLNQAWQRQKYAINTTSNLLDSKEAGESLYKNNNKLIKHD